MRYKMIMSVFYFIEVKEVNMSLQAKDGPFFSIGTIYSDLMEIQ
jgi:hypothetical protein